MFIINLTYKVTLEQVDAHLADHITYLEEQYAAGNFIASGRKIPRTGGVIFSKMASKDALTEVLNQDPFYKHDLVTCDIIEFIPTMTSEEFSILKE